MKRCFIFLIFFSALSSSISTYAQTVGNVTSVSVLNNTLRLQCGGDVVVFRVCTPNVLMINLLPNGIESADSTIIATTSWTPNSYFIDTSSSVISISTSKYRFEITRNPMRFSAYDSAGTIAFAEPSGGGMHYSGMFLNTQGGNFYGLHNKQSGYLTTTGGTINAGSQGEAGAPFIWTTKGWGMVTDMDTGTISINSNQISLFKVSNQRKVDLEFYFIFGSPKDIMNGMTDVTGKPPLFPKFTLGFMNTEWGIDETELKSDVAMYRSKGIPLDAYILDFDWMDWGADNYGEFRFGPKFPSASGGILKNQLLAQGVNLMGIRKPRVHVSTTQGQYASANNFFLGYKTDYFSNKTVGLLNFSRPDVRKWYWNSFIDLGDSYNNGIVGYWNDEADEFGGSSMFLQMQRSEYEGQRSYNDSRVWSVNRNFMLGAQRYAYGLWSGDIGTGFSVMSAQPMFMVSSILLGASWWSMDIGGFNGTPSSENYYRWIQFGAFVPIFRVHGTFGQEREPWNYGAEAEAISKKFIGIRYKLLPYIYSMAWENHLTGVSIARPLVMEYPEDNSTANISNEWMFGNDMLVEPVLQAGASSIQVYLPAGTWIDYWSGVTYYGPSTINYSVTKDIIPLFVKGGAVIPCSSPANFADDPSAKDKLILSCYPGGNRSAFIYEDDGKTYAYERGVYSRTDFQQRTLAGKIELVINSRTGSYSVPTRNYIAEFNYMISEPDTILIDNVTAVRTSVIALMNNAAKGWAYDSSLSKVIVRLNDDGLAHIISVKNLPDTAPPKADSVYALTVETIYVKFSEPVATGNSLNSSENISNYSLSDGMQVLSAISSADHRSVTLTTSKMTSNKAYQLTVSNIADISQSRNIMTAAQFPISIKPLSTYVVELQNGINSYMGTSDAHIAQNFPSNNMGGYGFFEVCRYGGNSADDKSALIKFLVDQNITPKDSLLKAEVVLILADTRYGTPDKQIGSYRLLKPWNEGTVNAGIDGATAATGEVTWSSAQFGSMPWTNAGGDFTQQMSSLLTVGSAAGTEYAWNITSFFNFWKAYPDSNFGIILREPSSSTENGTKVFYSRNSDTPTLRPKLRLTYINKDTGISNPKNIPISFALFQNYPNPFNPFTVINYSLATRANVSLKVFNSLGQEIATLVEGEQSEGQHSVNFSGLHLSSGLYFYTLRAGNFISTKKMVLIK